MTPERRAKIERVINHRQSTLVVVMENVHDPHNIMAVSRSCDSVGVQNVYIIQDPKQQGFNIQRSGTKSSSSANKWLDYHVYDSTEKCLQDLKANGFKILTTHLDRHSQSIYQVDFTEKVALVFGNEKYGVSDDALHFSDGNFIIPQVGMIQSLNISVACAVSLYEAFRQRQLAGFYDTAQLSEQQQNTIFAQWAQPRKK